MALSHFSTMSELLCDLNDTDKQNIAHVGSEKPPHSHHCLPLNGVVTG